MRLFNFFRRRAMLLQQGDVLFHRQDKVDFDKLQEVPQGVHRNVIAEGEVTGHAHRVIEGNMRMFTDTLGNRYMEVPERIVVGHEEHKPVAIDKGVYRLGGVREFDHWQEETRKVID